MVIVKEESSLIYAPAFEKIMPCQNSPAFFFSAFVFFRQEFWEVRCCGFDLLKLYCLFGCLSHMDQNCEQRDLTFFVHHHVIICFAGLAAEDNQTKLLEISELPL